MSIGCLPASPKMNRRCFKYRRFLVFSNWVKFQPMIGPNNFISRHKIWSVYIRISRVKLPTLSDNLRAGWNLKIFIRLNVDNFFLRGGGSRDNRHWPQFLCLSAHDLIHLSVGVDWYIKRLNWSEKKGIQAVDCQPTC